MKQTLLYFLGFCAILMVSCQKNQFVSFQSSTQTGYAATLKSTKIQPANFILKNEVVLPAVPIRNFSVSNDTISAFDTELDFNVENPSLIKLEEHKPQNTIKQKIAIF